MDVVDHRPGSDAGTSAVTARLGGQQLQLESIPVTAPGVQRFGAAGAGTPLGTADSMTVEYRVSGLPAVTSTFNLPRPQAAAPATAP